MLKDAFVTNKNRGGYSLLIPLHPQEDMYEPNYLTKN